MLMGHEGGPACQDGLSLHLWPLAETACGAEEGLGVIQTRHDVRHRVFESVEFDGTLAEDSLEALEKRHHHPQQCVRSLAEKEVQDPHLA